MKTFPGVLVLTHVKHYPFNNFNLIIKGTNKNDRKSCKERVREEVAPLGPKSQTSPN